MLHLDDAAVRAALPMRDAIEVVRRAMGDVAAGRAHQPLRSWMQPPGLAGGMLLKPAALLGAEQAVGVKVLTLYDDNPSRGLPAINGVVILFDPDTGLPVALLDGAAITEIRTGAASAVATDILARPDAGDLAIIGAGVQARAHLQAMAEVRDLRRVRVTSRTASSAEAFARWAAQEEVVPGCHVEVVATVEQAVDGADLVCTVTSTTEPVLQGGWVAPGCHVNAVGAYQAGARELAASVLAAAAVVVVDSREGAMAESGDLLLAIEEGALPAHVALPELGELVLAADQPSPGRQGAEDITVFLSLGLAVQDIAAAAAAVGAQPPHGTG